MTPRCYTVAQLLDLLALSKSTFYDLKRQHQLPFLEELKPRIGRRVRYRAESIDRYLAGQFGQPRAFRRIA